VKKREVAQTNGMPYFRRKNGSLPAETGGLASLLSISNCIQSTTPHKQTFHLVQIAPVQAISKFQDSHFHYKNQASMLNISSMLSDKVQYHHSNHQLKLSHYLVEYLQPAGIHNFRDLSLLYFPNMWNTDRENDNCS